MLVVLEYYLGVLWSSPSLGSCHSLFRSPLKLHPKLENFTKQNSTFRYCCKLIPILYLHYIYCILTSPWLIPPDTTHISIKISEQHNENRMSKTDQSVKTRI